MTIENLSRQIYLLVKNKKFDEALSYFKIHKIEVDANLIATNDFLVASMLQALRGVKAFDAGYKFLEIYHIKISDSSSTRILISYGWLIYFHFRDLFSQNNTDQSELEPIKNRLIHFLSNCKSKLKAYELSSDDETIYLQNLIEYLFKLIWKSEKEKQNIDVKFVYDICENINSKVLPTKSDIVEKEIKGKTKTIELASAREEWYVAYSRSLFELKEFQKCIDICLDAKLNLRTMHYNNDIWFDRRMAQSYLALNQMEEAKLLYENIINKKTDWFLLKELAEIYKLSGLIEKALELAKKAAATYGPLNYKVDLIELIGDLLVLKNDSNLALKHYLLVKYIRDAEGWKSKVLLEEKINKIGENNQKEKLTREELKKELTTFWNSNKLSKQESISNRTKGKIVRLLKAQSYGRDGFIQSDDGSRYYFFIPVNHPQWDKLSIGQQLEFEPTKTTKGLKAIKIRY